MIFSNPTPVPGDLQLKPDHATIVSVLNERSVLHPEKKAFTFLIDGKNNEISITYKELETYAVVVAMKLTELGLKGKRVLMLYPAGLDFIISFFGCLYSGVIPVPVYPPRKNRSLQRIHSIAANCDASAILTTTDISLSLKRNFAEDPFLKNLTWHATEQWHISGQAETDYVPEFEDLAFLQYTSGSTGDPKGVMVSHRNIMYNLSSIQNLFQINTTDVTINWVPQFHDLGLIFGIMETVFAGIYAVLISPVTFISDPACLFKTITRYKATISGQPDFAFNLCVDKTDELQRKGFDLSSLRVLYSGAEPVRKTTFERFLKAFAPSGLKPEALFPGYGMAESTLVLVGKTNAYKPPFYLAVKSSSLEQNIVVPVAEDDDDIRWITSNGKPNMDTSILIVDPETRTVLSADKVGEIWVKGSTVTLGYNNSPELTEKVYKGTLAGETGSYWLRTGDLGFLYNDELFITGRLKDLIIINGRNFYPQDIEKSIEESHSSIRKTCVAAFPVEFNGKERLAIVAELQRSILPYDTEKIMGSIVAAVSGEFEIQPARIALIRTGSLLKTSSGKIMRSATRESVNAGKLDLIAERSFEDKEIPQSDLAGLDATDLEKFLVMWISLHLNNGLPVDPSQSIITYGIDSIRAVELTDETKNVFGFEWPPYLFFEEISITQLAAEGSNLIAEM